MEQKYFQIHGIPAILWGSHSDKVYLYVHGRAGCKEEAEAFADIACHYAWQVLSIDLPEHGERKRGPDSLDPWHVVPELSSVMAYIKGRWTQISLFANSIGAWFSMLSFEHAQLEQSLFVSPILDMKHLISTMMLRANVSETELERERIITISSGQTLSWEYLLYAQEHPITEWKVPTEILYGEHDELTDRSVVDDFVHRCDCSLTVMRNGEHWFHTPEQLEVLHSWVKTCLRE